MADLFDQLGVVCGIESLTLGVGFENQFAAEDLRRLSLPKVLAREGLFDLMVRTHSLYCARNRNGKNGGAGFIRRGKYLRDPLVADAWPGGIVDADEIGLRFDPGQGRLDRIGPFGPAVNYFNA